MHQRHRTT